MNEENNELNEMTRLKDSIEKQLNIILTKLDIPESKISKIHNMFVNYGLTMRTIGVIECLRKLKEKD